MHSLVAFLLALSLIGCTPSPEPPPTDSPSPETAQSGPGAVSLKDRSSPIIWPEDSWQPSVEDFVSVSDWVGGVAGTDSDELKVQGDGTVTSTAQSQPSEEGAKIRSGKLSAEEAKAVFQRLKDSRLLEQEEGPSGTTGTTLTVSIAGVVDSISVAGRRAEAEALLGNVRSALK